VASDEHRHSSTALVVAFVALVVAGIALSGPTP